MLSRVFGSLHTALALLAVALFAVSSNAADAPVSAPAAGSDRVSSGKELYGKYCQLCHAKGGTGYAADHAPSLVSQMFLTAASDTFIARGIRLGRPNTAMAAYCKNRGGPLDDVQID